MRKEWKLSNFDKLSLGLTIKGAWIYEWAPDFEGMKFALAQLSDIYPHLAGHYDEKAKAIVWDEATAATLPFDKIELREYECSQLVGNAGLAWSLVAPYDIRGFKKGMTGPFKATLGCLKDGCILFVQCAHAAMDAQTFYSLVGQWAGLYRGEVVFPMAVDQSQLPSGDAFSKEETIRMVQERGWIRIRFKQIIKMLWNSARNESIRDITVLEVTQDEISDLRNRSGAGTNAVLAALTFRKFAEKFPGRDKFKLLFVADLRSRLKKMDSSFFGNLSQPVILEEPIAVSDDVVSVAVKIDSLLKAILSSERTEENVQLSQSSSHYGLPYFFFDTSDMNCPKPEMIYINNFLKFKANELDWGTGLPQYVFPDDLKDMVKFWQPVAGGNIQIIFAGFAAKTMK